MSDVMVEPATGSTVLVSWLGASFLAEPFTEFGLFFGLFGLVLSQRSTSSQKFLKWMPCCTQDLHDFEVLAVRKPVQSAESPVGVVLGLCCQTRVKRLIRILIQIVDAAGVYDYDSLAKVLEKDDEADARSDDEESLGAGGSDEDDEDRILEGFAAAGSDSDVSEDGEDDVREEGEEDSDEESLDFGEDVSSSEEEEGAGDEASRKAKRGKLGVREVTEEDEEGGRKWKGKRKGAGRGEDGVSTGGGPKLALEEGEQLSEGRKGGDSQKTSKKRKKGELGPSPFAAVEEYAHLLD
jgi:hypothetical protein